MKKVVLFAIVLLFIAIAFNSCKTAKCPAYSKNTIEHLEKRA